MLFQIQPVIANEGGAATFTAKFSGSPGTFYFYIFRSSSA